MEDFFSAWGSILRQWRFGEGKLLVFLGVKHYFLLQSRAGPIHLFAERAPAVPHSTGRMNVHLKTVLFGCWRTTGKVVNLPNCHLVSAETIKDNSSWAFLPGGQTNAWHPATTTRTGASWCAVHHQQSGGCFAHAGTKESVQNDAEIMGWPLSIDDSKCDALFWDVLTLIVNDYSLLIHG